MELSNPSRFPVIITFTWLVLLVHLVQSSSWLPSDEYLEVSPEDEESCEMGLRYKRDILGIFSNKRHKKRSIDALHQDQVTQPPQFQFATNQPLPWQQANDASMRPEIRPEIVIPIINVHGDEVTPGNIVRFTNQPQIFAPSGYPTTTPSPLAMNNYNVRDNKNNGFEVELPPV